LFIYFLEFSIRFWNCSDVVVIFRFSFFSVTFYPSYIPWNARDQCLSRLKLGVLIPLMARCFGYNIMWFSLSVNCDSGTPVSSNNKTDRQDFTEILLKVTFFDCMKHYTCIDIFKGETAECCCLQNKCDSERNAYIIHYM
jgi:hypothetical protein